MSDEQEIQAQHNFISGEGDAAHDGYPVPERSASLKTQGDMLASITADEMAQLVRAKPKAAMKPRLTVVDRVYFQSPDDEPVEATTSFSQEIASDEQPYSRKKSGNGANWDRLDTGWITDEVGCSMMVLENKGTSPIEVTIGSLATVLFTIPPGQSSRISSPNLRVGYHVRAADGARIKYNITLFPR